ncbi:MAG: 2-oxo acid dehydrogenase subunit E2 [Deltaproteobacteria bacterium]|nr:2-oxo acid dehydrogenase subunit E2 [Deltaproteobacteria bacterium]
MGVESKRAYEAVVMPQLGESIVEATLVRWLVAEGTGVTRGQPIAAIETDKASSEIPAPETGLLENCVAEGATVAVGHTIAEIRVGPPVIDDGISGPATDAGGDAQPESAGVVPTTGRLTSRPRFDAVGPARLSPAVRRIARQSGLDPLTIRGTGRHGRVTRNDMLRALERTLEPAPKAAAVSKTEVTGPASYAPVHVDSSANGAPRATSLSKRRRAIARELRRSLDTAVHVFAVAEIDMSRVEAARARDRAFAEAQGLRLTYLPYVITALAAALRAFPDLNASMEGETLTYRNEINVGVATETANGLVVPIVRSADELGLLGLARAVERLSRGARAGTLAPSDFTGGTFTVSNPGRDGNLYGVSIIRQPEVAILRMGVVQKRAIVEEINGQDAIFVRPMMYAALSYDHRVVDGRSGNAFLTRIKEHLQRTQPLSL